MCVLQKTQTLLFWCQGRRIFAWKVPSSFRQVGGDFGGVDQWVSGLDGCKLDDAKGDWRWLDVDFCKHVCIYIYMFVSSGEWRMLYVLEIMLKFPLHVLIQIVTHHWDYFQSSTLSETSGSQLKLEVGRGLVPWLCQGPTPHKALWTQGPTSYYFFETNSLASG